MSSAAVVISALRVKKSLLIGSSILTVCLKKQMFIIYEVPTSFYVGILATVVVTAVPGNKFYFYCMFVGTAVYMLRNLPYLLDHAVTEIKIKYAQTRRYREKSYYRITQRQFLLQVISILQFLRINY